METRFYRLTVPLIFIVLLVLRASDVKAVAGSFEIQVFDGSTEVMQPYTLISGKRYRLQAVSRDKKVLSARWFLSGNLGSVTTGVRPMLTAVLVGDGSLICRVAGIEQRVGLRVVPKTETIGESGGRLQSPTGVTLELPKGALDIEREIGVEIVASPGPSPPLYRVVRVIQISPRGLVLKQPAELTFLFGRAGFVGVKPQLYFWEAFRERWVPLQGRRDVSRGVVTSSINHFGIYTLMASGREDLKLGGQLQIQDIKLSPRLFFGLDRHRLTITYRLRAPDPAQIFVSMDIFDLRGRRVRRLLEEVLHYVGSNAAQWDGLTDDGRLVRNGRYLLVIRARTGVQRAVGRKLIIVFK